MMMVTILIAILAAIGVYWAFMSRHFLGWTTRYNARIHKSIDSHLTQPVLTPRAEANFARLTANGGLTCFVWTIRVIGTALACFALYMIYLLIAAGI
jgi:hypothetical protein